MLHPCLACRVPASCLLTFHRLSTSSHRSLALDQVTPFSLTRLPRYMHAYTHAQPAQPGTSSTCRTHRPPTTDRPPPLSVVHLPGSHPRFIIIVSLPSSLPLPPCHLALPHARSKSVCIPGVDSPHFVQYLVSPLVQLVVRTSILVISTYSVDT